ADVPRITEAKVARLVVAGGHPARRAPDRAIGIQPARGAALAEASGVEATGIVTGYHTVRHARRRAARGQATGRAGRAAADIIPALVARGRVGRFTNVPRRRKLAYRTRLARRRPIRAEAPRRCQAGGPVRRARVLRGAEASEVALLVEARHRARGRAGAG